MKLLILNYEYPPVGSGGGVVSQQISEGLVELGNTVTVLTTWFKGEKQNDTSGNLRIIRLTSKRKHIYQSNPIEMLSWIRKSKKFLSDYCKREKFDICLANFALPGGAVAYYLKKKFQLPYVIISHGHDIPWVHPKQLYFYHLLTYHWLRKICKQSEINVVLTTEMKTNIDRFLGKKLVEKNIIISNGCNYKLFKPDTSKRSKKLKIIFVGRLAEQKDPFTFLKAIEIYSRNSQDFTVHVLGDGPLRNLMEQFVQRNNLMKKVKFLGKIPKEQMIEEYQSAHLLIAPSVSEGMSIGILESLACGVYVITTRASGNKEMIKEHLNGELVEYRDYKEISKKIHAFYEGKFLKGYAFPDDVVREFRLKYDWKYIVNEYEKRLLKLLEV